MQDMQLHVWEELCYQLDLCHVASGEHIKYLCDLSWN